MLKNLYYVKYQSYCLLDEECYSLLQDYTDNKNFYKDFINYQESLGNVLKGIGVNDFSLLDLFRYLGIDQEEIKKIEVVLEEQKNKNFNFVKKITERLIGFFRKGDK